jgi:hypothetical protein
MGFCIGCAGTSAVPDAPPGFRAGSWGGLKAAYR